uniref:Amino acid transporter transmembrane domain-containing protein n=2 Tax=Glossina austeni TaxID=7395 RepID=A0A1A9VMD9_GLOAU
MKSIYVRAKQQLNNCIQLSSKECKDNHSHAYEIATIADSRLSSRAASTTLDLSNDFNVMSYDTSQKRFRYDKLRGRWSLAVDFYFACTSHAFGSVVFSELPVYVLLFGGVYSICSYLIGMLLYAIPIFGIQTFLGQFSSSGIISVFRVAPIFKGIGYSILFHNLATLSYYAVLASIPLIYAANSLHTVIPWMSCDNAWNSVNCSTHSYYDEEDEEQYPHATVEFFRAIIRSADSGTKDLWISWPMLCGVLAVWLLVIFIVLKKITFIGKFLRCLGLIMMTTFGAIFVHLLIHVEFSWDSFISYMEPTVNNSKATIMAGVRAAILMPTWVLGPGWGTILTLASHNSFRRNSEKLIYWISGTHMLMTFMALICGRIALDHFEDHVGLFHYHVEEEHNMQFLYLCFAYLFGSFTSLPNFWSFLFFSMLFMAELSAVIIQMMTVLTAIFDEYESARSRKPLITILMITTLLLTSAYFCTKQGFAYLHLLPDIVTLTHLTLSILLLTITTWIYGRERFQCDLQFMLGKTITNFKIFLLRFVTPAFLVISIFQVLYLLQKEDPPSLLMIIIQSLVYIIAPIYMVYKVCRTTGSLRDRLKQCFAPHDWHPVDADNRRFYEEIMGTSEMLVILDREHRQPT